MSTAQGVRWTVAVWSSVEKLDRAHCFGLYTERESALKAADNINKGHAIHACVMPIYPERSRKGVLERLMIIGEHELFGTGQR